MLATTSVGLLSFITHVILVKYEMYLCLSIFHPIIVTVKVLFCSLNSAYRWYVKEGGVHDLAKKEKMDVCVNQCVRPFSNSNSFSYSLYRTITTGTRFFAEGRIRSAKKPLPSAKALPRVALGKGRSA